MKDLDFDELDRAVNSLIAKGSANAKPDVGSARSASGVAYFEPVAPALEQAAASEPLIPDTNAPTEPVAATTPPVAAAPAAPKIDRPDTGRFMDVVHPSSNMRTSLVMPERTSTRSDINPAVESKTVNNIPAYSPQPSVAPTAPVAVNNQNIDVD